MAPAGPLARPAGRPGRLRRTWPTGPRATGGHSGRTPQTGTPQTGAAPPSAGRGQGRGGHSTRWRYSEGEQPMCFLKTRAKFSGLGNPQSRPIWDMGSVSAVSR